jgi:hypothetical protein
MVTMVVVGEVWIIKMLDLVDEECFLTMTLTSGWAMEQLNEGGRAFLIHRTWSTTTYVYSHLEAEEWCSYVGAEV